MVHQNIFVMKVLNIVEGSSSYKQISDEAFERIIISECLSAVVTLADEGMRGAAMMNTMMEGLCAEFSHQVAFFYNNPETSKLTEMYGLYDTAAVFFFANGILQDHQIGLIPKNKLREKIKNFITLISS
jgi:hypothetical protein